MQYEDWGLRSPRWVGIRSELMQLCGQPVQLLRADAAPSAPPGAPPHLLLHGLGAGGVFVLDLIRPLTAFGPVVAPDLPGSIFGHTATPHPRAPRVELNARFVRALSSELSLEPAVVHGWSMGAAVAIRFAADNPDRVAGVVLANPPLPVTLRPAEQLVVQTLGRLAVAVGPPVLRVLTRLWGRRIIEAKLTYLGGSPIPERFAGLGGNLSQIPDDTMAVWTEELAGLRSHPETLGYAATAFASVLSGIVIDQHRVWDAIDRIAAPVLLMWGDEDPLLERPVIDAVLARRSDWDLHVLAGAGHAAPVERPDEYAAAVRRWLTHHSFWASGTIATRSAQE